jgi:type II secretory pathway pseudopilin PulG
MPVRRSAFTLLELLIVISIVMVLIGLMVVGIQSARFQAKAAATGQRIDSILQGLQMLGQSQGNTAYVVQKSLWERETAAPKDIYGVILFDFNGLTPKPKVIGAGPSTYGFWLDVTKPYHFGYPWGKKDLFVSTTFPAGCSDTKKGVTAPKLRDLNPRKTLDLLAIAGIIRSDTAANALADYQICNHNKPWCDAWGRPLVVAYGIFQPSDADATKAGTAVQMALQQYQYNRSVYVAVGAIGPYLDSTLGTQLDLTTPTLTNAGGTLDKMWTQINDVCSPSATPEEWVATSWDAPPWQGVKRGRLKQGGRELRSLLSTPHELK